MAIQAMLSGASPDAVSMLLETLHIDEHYTFDSNMQLFSMVDAALEFGDPTVLEKVLNNLSGKLGIFDSPVNAYAYAVAKNSDLLFSRSFSTLLNIAAKHDHALFLWENEQSGTKEILGYLGTVMPPNLISLIESKGINIVHVRDYKNDSASKLSKDTFNKISKILTLLNPTALCSAKQ